MCFNIELQSYPDECTEDRYINSACPDDKECYRVLLKKEKEIPGSGGRKTKQSFFCETVEGYGQTLNRGPYLTNVINYEGTGTPSISTSATSTPTVEKATEATCEAGQMKTEQGLCDECPLNTYSDSVNAKQCTPCPENKTTNATATDSAEDCNRGAVNGLSFAIGVLYLMSVFNAVF